MKTSNTLLLAFAVSLSLLFGACSKKSADHDRAAAHDHPEGHHHTAPHGGTLVELGEHQFSLEFVREPTAGTLTAYVLDAHAENFIRLPLSAIPLMVTANGVSESLVLTAMTSEATGETVGDTSEFAAQADWLKRTAEFAVAIPALEIRGATFTDVRFGFPQGADDHDHDHGHGHEDDH